MATFKETGAQSSLKPFVVFRKRYHINRVFVTINLRTILHLTWFNEFRGTLCNSMEHTKLEVLGTFPKEFSQVTISQVENSQMSNFPSSNFPNVQFPKQQLPKCAISQVATSQMCNFPRGNFPNVQFPKRQLPKG